MALTIMADAGRRNYYTVRARCDVCARENLEFWVVDEGGDLPSRIQGTLTLHGWTAFMDSVSCPACRGTFEAALDPDFRVFVNDRQLPRDQVTIRVGGEEVGRVPKPELPKPEPIAPKSRYERLVEDDLV